MNTFSAKSIGLYSLAIACSIAFFQVITTYGEAHVRAPIAVTGNYAIAARNLTECLADRQLSLDLQQSGVYLTARLVDRRTTIATTANSSPTLSGRLIDRQLTLDGLLPTSICPSVSRLRIAGTIDSQQQLQGQLWLTPERFESIPTPPPTTFTAKLQPIAKQEATGAH